MTSYYVLYKEYFELDKKTFIERYNEYEYDYITKFVNSFKELEERKVKKAPLARQLKVSHKCYTYHYKVYCDTRALL